MKKMNNRGFVLAETLVVTTFVSGVLIFLFIQFTNISKNYENNYTYNTVDDLYALEDVKDYILTDYVALNNIESELDSSEYINISDCSMFDNKDYCLKLFSIENIDEIIVTKNYFDKNEIINLNQNLLDFIKKINGTNDESYRLIASFKNSTYATLRW